MKAFLATFSRIPVCVREINIPADKAAMNCLHFRYIASIFNNVNLITYLLIGLNAGQKELLVLQKYRKTENGLCRTRAQRK